MDEYINPIVSYGDDKKNPENYVRIEVDIKGLEKSLISKTASNAEIRLDVKDGSFCLTVEPKGKSKVSKYRFEVKQLPSEILPDKKKTFYAVERNDEVILYLHKAIPGSWARWLGDGIGLERDGSTT